MRRMQRKPECKNGGSEAGNTAATNRWLTVQLSREKTMRRKQKDKGGLLMDKFTSVLENYDN